MNDQAAEEEVDADAEVEPDDDAAEDEEAELRVAGRLVELNQLPLLSERWDIMVAYGKPSTNHRVEACALGLCWKVVRRRLPPYQGDVLVYGGMVLELLLKAKTPAKFVDVRRAGIRAVNLVLKDLAASENGVKEAEDF